MDQLQNKLTNPHNSGPPPSESRTATGLIIAVVVLMLLGGAGGLYWYLNDDVPVQTVGQKSSTTQTNKPRVKSGDTFEVTGQTVDTKILRAATIASDQTHW